MNPSNKANKTGSTLEQMVESTLQKNEYIPQKRIVTKKEKLESLRTYSLFPKRYDKEVYIGTGIYDTDIYVDFFIIGIKRFDAGLIIECKWQQEGGSVDEKYPYLNLNIEQCYPAPTMVVLAGKGMRQKASDWFQKQVSKNPNLVAVYPSLDDFLVWANNHL
jgi:hypothetical protein